MLQVLHATMRVVVFLLCAISTSSTTSVETQEIKNSGYTNEATHAEVAALGNSMNRDVVHRPHAAKSKSKKAALSTLLFKFMSNWKPPTLKNIKDAKKAEDMFGEKKLVVITGTSSGLGRKTARALLRTGKYHVVGAVRDLDKMKVVAELEEFPEDSFTAMHVELNSFDSVRKFSEELKAFKAGKPIDRLICNAGVYQPSLPHAKWSEDNIEQTIQINYLSHFLLVSLLLKDLAMAPDPRCILLGSVTGNDNTVGGGGVYPIADLKELEGLKAGAKNPISMLDGYSFIGAKAYKDSKLCNMMLANNLHDRYHRQTGIAFSSVYPGCIAESPLFREKREWFRKYFPIFMKFITGGFVSEEEAGQRLMQVAHDPRCSKSGVYWSWNGGPREGRGDEALEKDGQILGGGGAGGGWDSIYENEQSDKVLNKERASDLFKHSTIVTGAEWPEAYQPKSPCPTLKVIGGVTAYMNAKEEAKRMKAGPGIVGGLGSKAIGATAKVTDAVLGNTVGRVAKTAQDALLGGLPTDAVDGSFHETQATAKTSSGKKRGLLSRLRFWKKADKQVEGDVKAAGGKLLKIVPTDDDSETISESSPEIHVPADAPTQSSTSAVADTAQEEPKALANVLLAANPTAPFRTPRVALTRRSFPQEIKMGAIKRKAWKHKSTLAEELGQKDLDASAVGLEGDIKVVFKQGNVTKETMAIVGQPISEVAAQSAQYIKYKCKKGQCGTCEVSIDGKWVRSCVSKIPPVKKGETYTITVREAMVPPTEKSSRFFSPKSFYKGFKNNLLGMVGFVKGRRHAKENWQARMSEEQMIVAKAAEMKAARAKGEVKTL